MKYFLNLGAGFALYDSAVNKTIPAEAKQITDAQYETICADQRGAWSIVEGQPTQTLPTTAHVDAKAAKLADINAKAQADVAPYTDSYPPFEQKTWDQQATEAAAYTADNSSPTPWCDIAAAQRGIDRVEFIQKVQAKAQAFVQISATVAGYRQGLEDQLNAIDLTAADALTQISAIAYTSPLTPQV